jgi:hypothetical protein
VIGWLPVSSAIGKENLFQNSTSIRTKMVCGLNVAYKVNFPVSKDFLTDKAFVLYPDGK